MVEFLQVWTHVLIIFFNGQFTHIGEFDSFRLCQKAGIELRKDFNDLKYECIKTVE
jgi:hypothetical protein